jgi:hypothetical protein
LDPLLEATRRVFPTARQIKVSLQADPDICDLWTIVFDVFAPRQDVPNFVEAVHKWTDEYLDIFPPPYGCHCVLGLDLV